MLIGDTMPISDLQKYEIMQESLKRQEELASSTESLAGSTNRMAISSAKSARYTKWIAIATFIVAFISLITCCVNCYFLFLNNDTHDNQQKEIKSVVPVENIK